MDDGLRQTLWDWGRDLRARRQEAGLDAVDVARLVGLGWDPRVVEAVEDGRGSVPEALEVSQALGWSVKVRLVESGAQGALWRDGLAERERARRAEHPSNNG